MSHLSSSSRIARSPARNPLSFRTMQTKVTLLDGSLFTYTVEVRMLGTGETAGDRLKQVEKAGDRWKQVRQVETSRDSFRPLKIGGDRLEKWRQLGTAGERWRQMKTGGDSWKQVEKGETLQQRLHIHKEKPALTLMKCIQTVL